MNISITNLNPITPDSLDKALDIFGEVSISFDNNNIKLKVEKIADVVTVYRGTLYIETSSLGYYDIGYIEKDILDDIIRLMITLNKFSNRRN